MREGSTQHFIEELADKLVDDEGELYDVEKEGGDARNETAPVKRPAVSSPDALMAEVKKSKMDNEEEEKAEDKITTRMDEGKSKEEGTCSGGAAVDE